MLVKEGERLSDELQDDESYRFALVNLCAGTWVELQRTFDEVAATAPFQVRAVRVTRRARGTAPESPALWAAKIPIPPPGFAVSCPTS